MLNAFLHPFYAFLEHFYTQGTIPSQGDTTDQGIMFPQLLYSWRLYSNGFMRFSPTRNTLSTHQDKKLKFKKQKKHNHLCLPLSLYWSFKFCQTSSDSFDTHSFLCSQFPLNIAPLPKHFLVHNFLPPYPVSPLTNISVIQMLIHHSCTFFTFPNSPDQKPSLTLNYLPHQSVAILLAFENHNLTPDHLSVSPASTHTWFTQIKPFCSV